MVARMPQARDESAPYSYNGYVLPHRLRRAKSIRCMSGVKQTATSGEVLADGNERAQGLAYYELVSLVVSADNAVLRLPRIKSGAVNIRVAYRDLADNHWQGICADRSGRRSGLVSRRFGSVLYPSGSADIAAVRGISPPFRHR